MLSEKYGEEITVDEDTVTYLNVDQRVNLRAHPVSSPERSFLVEVYLAPKEMEFSDNYIINEALNHALQKDLYETHFYIEGNYDGYSIETKERMRRYNLQQFDEQRSKEFLEKIAVNITVFTDLDMEKDEDVLLQQLYEVIRDLKDLNVEVGSFLLNFPKESTDPQQELTLKKMVGDRQKSSMWDDYPGAFVNQCFISAENIKSADDVTAEINECYEKLDIFNKLIMK